MHPSTRGMGSDERRRPIRSQGKGAFQFQSFRIQLIAVARSEKKELGKPQHDQAREGRSYIQIPRRTHHDQQAPRTQPRQESNAARRWYFCASVHSSVTTEAEVALVCSKTKAAAQYHWQSGRGTARAGGDNFKAARKTPPRGHIFAVTLRTIPHG